MRLFFLFLVVISLQASAQVPQAINYQGILRNASGQAVSMKTINVQVSITSDKTFSISKLLYSERFTVITNEFGTYAISIGYGKPVTGTFSGIDWSTGKQWIFVEVDENLNNVYEFVGSMQFSSVPYALYANTAKIADSVRNAVGIQGPKGATGAAGTNGTNGATWYTGTVVPATTTGALNDLYLNTTTGEYYKKTGANIWTMQANLTGPQGQQGLTGAAGPQGPTGAAGAAGTSGTSGNNGATWYTGSGTASSTTGVVNDLYLNIATGDYYKKTGASTWTFLANISTGIPGPQGPQGLQGPAGATGATGPQGPAGATGAQGPQGLQGVAGATGATGSQGLTGSTGAQGPQGLQGVAGPTGAAGTSGANGTNGTNGSTWYTGTIAPSTGTGVVNDFYLNTSNGDYYKKTGASTWTLQANLTGPQGATGSQGIQGVAGPTGATGAAGSNATITMGTIAATSNVNGGTITSGVLTLTPADATNGGVLTTGVQTITGTKTYINDINVNGKIKVGAVTYPNVDGTAGQVLSTTGSGTLTWTNASSSNNSSTSYDWHIPDGYNSIIPFVDSVIYPYNSYGNTNDVVSTYGAGFVVPAGKNLYLYNTKCSPFWGHAGVGGVTIDGIYLDQYQSGDIYSVSPSIGGSNRWLQNINYPMIIGPGSVISMNTGSSQGSGNNTYNFLAISGFLVDKTVDPIFVNTTYTVPDNYYFVRMKPLHMAGDRQNNSTNYYYYDFTFPIIYDSNKVVPAKTNGYLKRK